MQMRSHKFFKGGGLTSHEGIWNFAGVFSIFKGSFIHRKFISS